jgi:hypothetical protein
MTADLVLLVAACSSLVLTGVLVVPSGRGRRQWTAGLGFLAFAAESVIAYELLGQASRPENRLIWLQALQMIGCALLVPWGLFVATLLHRNGTRFPVSWRLCALGAGAVVLATSAVLSSVTLFSISDSPAPFYAARLEPAAGYAAIAQLLATVGILAGLEMALRTAERVSRWRIKYLILGVGGIFLVRFYFLTQLLLFQVLLVGYLTTQAATLTIGSLVIAASLFRDRLISIELTISRHVLYRSVMVAALGLYLFVVGALGWFLNSLGIAENLFWGSLVIFVAAIGAVAFLLSDDARWRVKRFIALHFYRSKYDYREQWITFTKRLGSLVAVEELAPQLLGAVADAVGATRAVLYLANEQHRVYYPVANIGIGRTISGFATSSSFAAQLRGQRAPLAIEASPRVETGMEPSIAELFTDSVVLVPLLWRNTLTGIMVVGSERTGRRYTVEDIDFLATVGQQAAGAIVTAQLSEAVARSREFEAFHHLTSFVIHDLKNSTAALSLLSQNALANFDDPEFQRDAIRTLSKTVERMKSLLAKLSSAPDPTPLRLEPVDLVRLVDDATAVAARHQRIKLIKDLASLPRVPGDPETLLNVVQNLITNAVEALEGSGEITVRTYQEGEWAVLSVADTGCGISEEFLRKSLFAPFRSTKKGGWGIGLYQARGIVEAHGGSIDAASKQGEGTTFWVRLPLERRSSAESSQ